MAYDRKNLFLIAQGGGQRAQRWVYEGTDTVAAVAAAGFISDAYELGMKVGDEITVKQYSSTAFTTLTQSDTLIATAVVSGTGATLKKASVGAATASAGAATLNTLVGAVTTESLTTAAGDTPYTLTVTNSQVAASDVILVSIQNGTNSAGVPLLGRVTPGSGSVVITVYNKHASAALNGTLIISYVVFKA